MDSNKQLQKPEKTKNVSQKQLVSHPRSLARDTHPAAIIQGARADPRSLTPVDVLQLQRTIGNRAVGRLLSEIGRLPSTAHQAPVQRQPEEEEELQMKPVERRQELEEEEPLQGKMVETVQREEIPEEEEPLQGKFIGTKTGVQRQEEAPRPNNTGLPDKLKAGIENYAGMPMDDVRVHYNSSMPARIHALAYTQGTEIHIAPGQERHLPHEAWHVVQQKKSCIEPSIELGDMRANLDSSLEREAEVMGARAHSMDLSARLPSAADVAHSSQALGQSNVQRAPSGKAVRQFICGSGNKAAPSLDNVINTSAKSDPNTIAKQLTESSEAFKALRGTANKEVARTFGKGKTVGYKSKPKTGGGTGPAYYKDGVTYFDKNAPMPQTVLNIVFETANAAQAGKFRRVETDFDNKTLMTNPMTNYIDDPSQMGKYADDFKDEASKRSLIQEFYEWNSFLIAKNALLELSQKYKSEVASVTWETSFGAIMKCENFEQYYDLYGNVHRKAVQGTLEQSVKQDKGKQVDIGKLFF